MDKLGCASSPPREGESMGTITEVAAAATAAAEEELLVVVAAAAAAARGEGEGEQQKKKKNFVSWCFEPSQPQGITSGLRLRKIFLKRYTVKRTNKAEKRPEEQSEKAESCRDNL